MTVKKCPLMTIAHSILAGQFGSHGVCQEESCAWWDPFLETCAIFTIAEGIMQVSISLRGSPRRGMRPRKGGAHD